MKKIYLLLFAVVSYMTGTAQLTYQKAHDFGNDDYVNMLLPEPNSTGAHFLVGSTNSTGAGGYDAMFAKTDASGIVLWEKQYGGNRTEFGTCFIKASDGNYVIAGRTNSFSASTKHDAFIAKVDPSGTLLWAKSYGTDSTEYAFAIVEAPDSGYVIAGVTYGGSGAPKNNGRLDIMVVKTDINGNAKWSKSVGSINGNEVGYSLAAAGNNGFLVGGYSGINITGGLNDNYFSYLDWNGNLQLSYLYGGVSDDDIRNIVLANNGFMVAGNTRSNGAQGDLFVSRFNVNGGVPGLAWTKSYGTSSDEYITNFKQVNNNEFLLIGHTTALGTNGTSFVTAIDSNGVSQWTKYFDGPQNDNLSDVDVLPSGSLLFAGYSTSFGGTASNSYQVLTSANGTSCQSNITTISDSTRRDSIATLTSTDFTADTMVIAWGSIAMLTNTNTATPYIICVSTGINDVAATAAIQIYPNPASSTLTIAADENIHAVKVIDQMGRVIYERTNVNTEKTNLSVADFAAGIYIVTVTSETATKNLRLSVEK